MKQLFPAEIQQNSIQSLWVKRNKRTQIIYLVIILVIIAVFVSLPLVYVDVSAQSRGAVKAINENNTIVSAVYAEVKAVNLYENKAVHKGDTLIWLNTDELDDNELNNVNGGYLLTECNKIALDPDKFATESIGQLAYKN